MKELRSTTELVKAQKLSVGFYDSKHINKSSKLTIKRKHETIGN